MSAPRRPRFLTVAGCTCVLAVAATAAGCDGIDTRREAQRKATLGDDIYGLMCDRLGASVFTEDLIGASYHDICHFDASGLYGSFVDVSVLPPVSGEGPIRARALSIAKMERMAAHRAELVAAFNGAFPDVEIPDPTTEDSADTVRLHDALMLFSQDITPLYETSPFEDIASAPEALLPATTDAFGRLFESIEESDDARLGLQRIAGRRGYRPYPVGLGAIRTVLSYPQTRAFLQSQLPVLGNSGSAAAELQKLLEVVRAELTSATANVSELPPLTVGSGAQPNRPRSAMEVVRALLLDEHGEYAGSGESRYVVRRDRRGFAQPVTLAPPFVDGDGDALADVDALGRFVGGDGMPLAIDFPFSIPDETMTPADAFGRPQGTPFAYLDTSQTLLGALSRDMLPLVDATTSAAPDSETPWLAERETLMYALAGLFTLAGPRQAAQFDHTAEVIVPPGQRCPVSTTPNPLTGEVLPCTDYQRFVAERSPLADIAHAVGQVLAHPDSDVILLGLLELVTEHRAVVARLIGAGLRAKEIADAHDELAAGGVEPRAELPYETPIWDEMAQVLSRMAQQEGLIAGLLTALGDPVLVTPHPQDNKITGPPAQHMGDTIAAFMRFRDRYSYDPNDINGPAYNVTEGYPSFANPRHPVDRQLAQNGDNRSMFERALQLIHDGSRVKACNKNGARVYTGLGNIYVPPFGSYDECGLFVFDNVGAYYLDANLPAGHPKRSELVIQDDGLDDLLDFLGTFANLDSFLETSSGINGFTLHPTPRALNRLMFYGADSEQWGQLPDYDATNSGTKVDKFVGAAIEPLCGIVSPLNGNGVPSCLVVDNVLRLRDRHTIFSWERLGFYDYLAPQLKVFAEVACDENGACDPSDYTGENFFLDLMSTLWRHWPSADHGPYCSSVLPTDDPAYCSGVGVSHYEPIIGDVMAEDLLPALHAFASTAASVDITYERGPKTGQTINGTEIVELLVKIMFDQSHAASVGMRDRAGNAGAVWVDGTPQDQVTPYNMFADALHGMDRSFDESTDPDAASRRGRWKRARSQLVDQFLTIGGEAEASRFENAAVAQALGTGLSLLREQLNANCPDREASATCVWAQDELGQKMADAMSRPLFSTVLAIVDKLNDDENARRGLERLLTYALSEGGPETLPSTIASVADIIQLLPADGELAPILRSVAVAATPRAEGAGAIDRTLLVLEAMSGDAYDRYHVLDYVLPAFVTPLDGGAGLTPLEVIVDAIADIHRVDAELTTPLDAADYHFVMKTLREFLVSEERGLRQLYFIVRNRLEP